MKLSAPAQGLVASGVSAASFPLRVPNGTVSAPSLSWSGDTTTGLFNAGSPDISFAVEGVAKAAIYDVGGLGQLGFYHSGSFSSAIGSDGAAVLAIKNAATAQALRIYGTTTGPKYLSLSHNGTDGVLYAQSGALNLMGSGASGWSVLAGNGLVSLGNYRFAHGTSALATDATEGFYHMNSCAGAPTGTPASIPSGQIPMVFDTTNHRLYFYEGGAWHYVARTA